MQEFHQQQLSVADANGLDAAWPFIDNMTAMREPDWIQLRRHLHRSPEPSGEEYETSRLILERLQADGIPASIPERGVGVVADIDVGDVTPTSPVIALRADIDALRMDDDKSCEHSSQRPGLAHACGHDVHTTIVLAAAELISQLQSQSTDVQLPATRFRLIFQSAEETCQGALWMIEDGMLKDVDCILGLHVEPLQPVGKIGICYGALTAQVDEITIDIRGVGGHTARPHNTTDPIAAAGLLVSSLYQVLPRSVDVRDPAVFSFGTISGGTASNVIPDAVQLAGILRTTDQQGRETLCERIRQTCRSIADLTGNRIEVQFTKPLGAVRNSPLPTSAFELASRQVLGDSGTILLTRPSMGGEDFAMYLDHVPGSQIRLGCAGHDQDWPLLHSPVFDIDDRTISIGARVLSRAALLTAVKYGRR